jgi:hypothetical protein
MWQPGQRSIVWRDTILPLKQVGPPMSFTIAPSQARRGADGRPGNARIPSQVSSCHSPSAHPPCMSDPACMHAHTGPQGPWFPGNGQRVGGA